MWDAILHATQPGARAGSRVGHTQSALILTTHYLVRTELRHLDRTLKALSGRSRAIETHRAYYVCDPSASIAHQE